MSRNPLFPVIVALWFGALFGVGSLMVRTSVLENAVLAAHLDTLVPAAAPPLGFTARLLVAAFVGLIGAFAGFVLARLLARKAGGPAKPRAARAEPAAHATVDDNDDLARLDAARGNAPPRRRALSLENDPATNPSVLRIDDLADIDAVDAQPVREAAQEPYADSLTGTAPEPEPAQGLPVSAAVPAAQARPAAPVPAATPDLPVTLAETTAQISDSAAAHLRASPLDSLSVPQLVERFALALASRRLRRTESAPAAVVPAAAVPVTDTPPPFAPPLAPAMLAEPLASDPAPEGIRPFDMPSSMNQAGLGSIDWFDEVEEEATLASLQAPGRTRTEPNLWSEDAEAADEGEAPFSSLLDMKPPQRETGGAGKFVRIEEETAQTDIAEPVVVFPGQAVPQTPIPARLPGAPFGATPVETEAALREALVALQKMSGAA